MAVFRAPDDKENSEDKTPEENNAISINNNSEINKLNEQRKRFDDDPINYGSNDFNEEKELLTASTQQSKLTKNDEIDSPIYEDQSQSESDSFVLNAKTTTSKKKFSFGAKSKIMLAAGSFLMPTLIGLFLFLLAFQAGFILEHVTRITTGLRFARFHSQLAKRTAHIQHHVLSIQAEGNVDLSDPNNPKLKNTDLNRRIPNYERTTIGRRLMGTTNTELFSNLRSQGVDIKYSRTKGNVTTFLRRTISEVTVNGKKVPIKNLNDIDSLINNLKNNTFSDSSELNRFRANRARYLLAKDVGIPFARFRLIIKGLRDGSLKHLVRGSPQLAKEITKNMLTGKIKLRGAGRLVQSVRRLGGGTADIKEVQNDALNGKSFFSIKNKLKTRWSALKPTTPAASIAPGVATGVAIVTFVCVIREIGAALKDIFTTKVAGLQDSAASIITTTSQVKAGEMDGAIISDMSQRFNGFATSANYQFGALNANLEPFLESPDSNFAAEFAADRAFDGFFLQQLYKISSWFQPENFLKIAKDVGGPIFNGLLGFANGVLGIFGTSAEKIVSSTINPIINSACNFALSKIGGFVLVGFEVALTLLSGAITGGTGIIAWQTVKLLVKGLFFELVAGLALDYLLFNVLLPSMITASTGVDSLLTSDPDNPKNGARNYAMLDYGMHYLKEAEALNMGGSQIPATQEVARTQAYLKDQKQYYVDQGIWSNLFASNNPYSATSQILVAQNGKLNFKDKSQTYVSGLFNNLASSFNFSNYVHAETQVSSEELAEFLYPGQEYIIGFDDRQIEGLASGFDHLDNTLTVGPKDENSDYSDKYEHCLGLSLGDYLFDEAIDDIDGTYKSHDCNTPEAQQYKMYYLDCQLIDNMTRWGTNTSPMYSNLCDYMLPDEIVDEIQDDSTAINQDVAGALDSLNLNDYQTTTLNEAPQASSSFLGIKTNSIYPQSWIINIGGL